MDSLNFLLWHTSSVKCCPIPNNQVVVASCFQLVPFYRLKNTYFSSIPSPQAQPQSLCLHIEGFLPLVQGWTLNIERTICLFIGLLLTDMLKNEHCFKLWELDYTRSINPCTHFILRYTCNICVPWKGYGKLWSDKQEPYRYWGKLFVDILHKQSDEEFSFPSVNWAI